MSETLLPCPFCGSCDLVVGSHPIVDGWSVTCSTCSGCGASSFAITTDDDEHDESETTKRWNRRTPPPATNRLLDWLTMWEHGNRNLAENAFVDEWKKQ